MKKNILLIAAAALSCVTGMATAGGLTQYLHDFRQAEDKGKTSTQLLIDNDSLLLNKNDGFYTSGLQLRQQYALHGADQLSIFGWRIGQELYTASDIKLPPAQVGPPDHPYAGWLYGGAFKEIYRADGTYLKTGIDIGCLGPCAGGEWTQTTLHRLLHQPLPQGWNSQVRNEWGAVLYADMAPVRWHIASWLDATPNLHGRFGNIYTDAGAGVTLRAGKLAALPDQPGLHGFMRMDVTAIGYNATLQGGYFSSGNPHTVQPKRWVGEAEIGADWRSGPYAVAISVIRRSNEIMDLANSIGTQNFARLVFSYAP